MAEVNFTGSMASELELARKIKRYRETAHPDRRRDGAAFLAWARIDEYNDLSFALSGFEPPESCAVERDLTGAATRALKEMDPDSVIARLAPIQARHKAERQAAEAAEEQHFAEHRAEIEAAMAIPNHRRSDAQQALCERHKWRLEEIRKRESEDKARDEARAKLKSFDVRVGSVFQGLGCVTTIVLAVLGLILGFAISVWVMFVLWLIAWAIFKQTEKFAEIKEDLRRRAQ